MQCPSCRATHDLVVDSRVNPAGTEIRRRRECQTCHTRFTTYEAIRDHDPEVYARQFARAKDIAAQLRDMARTLEVW